MRAGVFDSPFGPVEMQDNAAIAHGPGLPVRIAANGEQWGILVDGGIFSIRVDHAAAHLAPDLSVMVQDQPHPTDSPQVRPVRAPKRMDRHGRRTRQPDPVFAVEVVDRSVIADNEQAGFVSPPIPEHIVCPG